MVGWARRRENSQRQQTQQGIGRDGECKHPKILVT
jgi:hypothetical protein